MNMAGLCVTFLSCGISSFYTWVAVAEVVVLANRTRNSVVLWVSTTSVDEQKISLASGDLVPLSTRENVTVQFFSDREKKNHQHFILDGGNAYYLGNSERGRIGLYEIGLGKQSQKTTGESQPLTGRFSQVGIVPVKILVDEEESGKLSVWQTRLRKRVLAASDILERHCFLRFDVVSVDTWDSDDRLTEFGESLAEFRREVDAHPACLAIGFSSQYTLSRGRIHLGGIGGPLDPHILIREWSRSIGEPLRLKVLVHELGHYLGAVHSPESTSVMCPVLGDLISKARSEPIRFDPVNTLSMCLLSEEMRFAGIRRFSQLSPGTRRRLEQIYGALAPAMVHDRATHRAKPQTRIQETEELADCTQRVVRRLVRAAAANAGLSGKKVAIVAQGTRRCGDRLTNYYVRQAAKAAGDLPDSFGPPAMILGLGIIMDDSDILRKNLQTRKLVRAVETTADRLARLRVLGNPTIAGRRDLAKHFFLSACLTMVVGRDAAEMAGLSKERSDAQQSSGFSFVDVAANQAGILFAVSLLKQRFSLEELARGFRVSDYFPSLDGLEEGLSEEELQRRYFLGDDSRLEKAMRDLRLRLSRLAPYQKLAEEDVLFPLRK